MSPTYSTRQALQNENVQSCQIFTKKIILTIWQKVCNVFTATLSALLFSLKSSRQQLKKNVPALPKRLKAILFQNVVNKDLALLIQH